MGKYRQLYMWNKSPPGYEYWGVGCKKLGAIMQLIPILVIPVTGFIQTWRYLSSGPPDILEVSYSSFLNSFQYHILNML